MPQSPFGRANWWESSWARALDDDLLGQADEVMRQLQAGGGTETVQSLLDESNDVLEGLTLDPTELQTVRSSPARTNQLAQPIPQEALLPPEPPSLLDIQAAKKAGQPLTDTSQPFTSPTNPWMPAQPTYGRGSNVEPGGMQELNDFFNDIAQGTLGVASSGLGLLDYPTMGYAGKLANKFGFDPEGWKEAIAGEPSAQRAAAKALYAASPTNFEKVQTVFTNPTLIAELLNTSAPGIFAAGALGQGAAGLGLVSEGLAGAAGEGLLQAGGMAEGVRRQTESGLLTPGQAALSLSSGLVTGGISAISGRIGRALGIEDIDELVAGAAINPVARRNFLSAILMGAAKEGVLEELPQSVSEQVHQNLATGRPIMEGVNDAAVLGTIAGTLVGGGANAVTSISQTPAAQPVPPPDVTARPWADQPFDDLAPPADPRDLLGIQPPIPPYREDRPFGPMAPYGPERPFEPTIRPYEPERPFGPERPPMPPYAPDRPFGPIRPYEQDFGPERPPVTYGPERQFGPIRPYEREFGPETLNPKLTNETIRGLQALKVPEPQIRAVVDEDEGRFLIESLTPKKPKVPLRPRQVFPQTPGMKGYLGKDQEIADEREFEKMLEGEQAPAEPPPPPPPPPPPLPPPPVQPKGVGSPAEGAREPEDREVSGTDTGDDAERGDAGAGLEASTPLGRETPAQTERRRVAHVAAVEQRVLDAAQAVDPAADPADVLDELRQRVAIHEEGQEATRQYGPRSLLQRIAEMGGISTNAETPSRPNAPAGLVRELAWLKESHHSGPFGNFGGVRNVFSNERGSSLDEILNGLKDDPKFSYIEDTNDLLGVLEDVSRRGAENTEGIFPGLKELKRYGVNLEERWWAEPRSDADETGAPAGADTFDANEFGEEQGRLPGETGAVRDQEQAQPTLAEPPFSLQGETQEKPGKQTSIFDAGTEQALDDALDGLDGLLGRTTEPTKRSLKRRVADVLGMAAPVDAKMLMGVKTVFETLGKAGVTDFAKAVNILADKRGAEWVQNIAFALPKAWDMARRGNPAMGAAGDVAAILAAREPTDAVSKSGREGDSGKADGRSGGGEDSGPRTGRAGDSDDAAVPPESGADVVAPGTGAVQPKADDAAGPERQRVERLEAEREAAERSSHFAPYARRSDLRGADHPKVVTETRPMSGVAYPPLTASFQSPAVLDAIAKGRVSVEQAEQALAAVQANVAEQGEGGSTADAIAKLSELLPEATVSQLEKLVAGAQKADTVEWRIRSDDGGYSFTTVIHDGQDDPKGRLYAWNTRTPRVGAGIAFHDTLERNAGDVLRVLRGLKGTPGRPGHGYLVADAGGVGKSRELALTLLELMHRAEQEGRELRLLFTTLRAQNITDFINDELPFVASGHTKDGRDLNQHDELTIERGPKGTVPFEIVLATDTARPKAGVIKDHLPTMTRGIYVVDHGFNFREYAPLLQAANLHGIVADEAHEVRNIRDSAKGVRWQLLHAHIYQHVPREQQVFVYSTATPAQEPRDFEYLYGMRMWPIDGFADWLQVVTGAADEATANRILDYITQRGNQAIDTQPQIRVDANGQPIMMGRSVGTRMTRAEAEQVPRELKALGRMSARDLWRGGTEFRIWHAPDGSEHNSRMPEKEEARYNQFAALAIKILKAGEKIGKLAGDSTVALQQNAQLVLAAKRMQMEATLHEAIKLGQKYVASGHQVVYSVLNVSETDMGSHGNLYAAINAIPEHEVNPDGSKGATIPGVAELKQGLIEEARVIGKLVAPAAALKDAFGADQVAEMVGGMDDTQKATVRQFQNGERAVILISATGSTGVNLQQKFLTGKGTAQGRRVFIPVQNEWSALREMQRYWRVDRADSVEPPIIQPISFGSALQKRFFGSIAARMKSAGALSTGGGSEKVDSFDQFDFTDRLSRLALRTAWERAPEDLRELFWGKLFKRPDGTPVQTLPDNVNIETVQKALMFISVNRANQFWNLFIRTREELKDIGFDAADAHANTNQVTGRVLRSFELGPHLTLHQMVDSAGRKFGILQGVVTPFMPRIAPVIADSQGKPRRAYTVMKVNKTGEFVSGLDIEWARIERVARVFGRDLGEWKTQSKQQVIDALLVGEHVQLQAKNERGNHLMLRASAQEDNRVIIDYATLKMRQRLTAAGADYDGRQWTVQRAKLSSFLNEFQPSDDWGMLSSGEPEALLSPTSRGGTAARPASQSQQKRKALWRNRLRDPHLQLGPRRGPPVTTKAVDQMSPRAIREFLEKGLQITIQRGVGRASAWGFYRLAALGAEKLRRGIGRTHPDIIRLKVAEDLPVMMHEIGHHLAERVLGINLEHYETELLRIGAPTTLPHYKQWMKLHEGAAEFTRRWFTDPDSAFQLAPTFGAAFEDALRKQPELWAMLTDARDQLRAFQDLDGAERVKASISFDPQEGATDTGPVPYTAVDMFQREVLDELHRLEQAVTDMRGGVSQALTEDAYRLARLARGSTDKARHWLKDHVRDEKGQFRALGLEGILKPIKGRLEDFAAYLVAQRALELHQREDVTEWAINPKWAAETVARHASPEFEKARKQIYDFQDAVLVYALENGVLSAQQVRAMKRLNQNYVPFMRVMDAWAAAYGNAASGAMANLSGPWKPIQGSGRDIINPLESIVKNTFAIVNLVEHNRAMQALTDQATLSAGSGKWLEKDVEPKRPHSFNLSKLEKEIRKRLQEQGVELDPMLDFDKLVEVWVPAAYVNGADRYVTVLKKGKREWWKVNDHELFETIKALGPQTTSVLLDWFLFKPASLLRKSVTSVPSFIWRNMLRDPWVAFIQSEYGFIPGLDHLYGLYHTVGRTDLFHAAMNAGMGQAVLNAQTREGADRELRKLTGQKARHVGRRILDTISTPFSLLSAVSEAVELAPRMAEFRLGVLADGVEAGLVGRMKRSLTDRGKRGRVGTALSATSEETLRRSALAGRDLTLDFARGGRLTRSANRAIPFLNAQVQGYARTVSTLKKGATQRPIETAVKIGTVPLLSMLLWALNHDDDDYRKLEAWERDTYWHIPARYFGLGPGFIRIPKPFEYASVFGNTFEAGLDYLNNEDPEAMKRLLGQFLGSSRGTGDRDVTDLIGAVTVRMMPAMLLPIMEAMANHSYFFDRNISSTYRGDPDEQWLDYDRWTSFTARELGRVMNQSPKKIEHVIYGYTGNMGAGMLRASDYVQEKLGAIPVQPKRGLQDIPGIGTSYTEPGHRGQTRSIRRLYDMEDKLRGEEGVLGDLPVDALAQRLAVLRNHPELFQVDAAGNIERTPRAHAIREGIQLLRDQRKRIDATLESTTLTAEQKRTQLNFIADTMDLAARIALGEPVRKLPVRPRTDAAAVGAAR